LKPILEEQLHVEEELKRQSLLQQREESTLPAPTGEEGGDTAEEAEFEEIKQLVQPKKKLPPALFNLLKSFIQTVESKRQFTVSSVTAGLILTILFEIKLLAIALCLVLMTIQVPDNDIMLFLKEYLPQEKVITQRKKIPSSSSATVPRVPKSVSSSVVAIVPRANFSGVWKRGKLVNFEEFAAAQGASYVQRKLASSMTMTHTITMDPALTVMRLQEKGGPISNDALLVIGGEGVEVSLGPKTYLDRAVWDSPDVLRVTRLILPDRDHELIMVRRLESNGQVIRQDQTYHNFATGVRVDATSYFDLQGPSPNPLPASVHLKHTATGPESDDPDATEVTEEKQVTETPALPSTVSKDKRDLSGVWVRSRTHNVDSYVGAQGAGFVQRKLAVSVAMTHTITMNPPDLTAFRLQERGGPLDSDITYSINTAPIATQIMKRNFMDTVVWIPDSNPPTLVVTRVHEDQDFTLVHKRYIDEDEVGGGGEPTLVLVAKHIDHATGTETVGTSWYRYSGPSPNPPPHASGVQLTPSASTPPQVSPSPAPTSPLPSIAESLSETDLETATTAAAPPVPTPAAPQTADTAVATPPVASALVKASPSKSGGAKEAEASSGGGMPKRMLSMTLK
jgi:hypothetical protein